MEKLLVENDISQGIRLGYSRDNLSKDCLAFAHYLLILSGSVETVIRYVELMTEQPEKVGLQI